LNLCVVELNSILYFVISFIKKDSLSRLDLDYLLFLE